jgi:hypothetical protein
LLSSYPITIFSYGFGLDEQWIPAHRQALNVGCDEIKTRFMKYFIYAILFCILLIGCSKSSVFVADKDNDLLPEYSESGRNIAGALLNDTAWRSNVDVSSLSGTYMNGFWIISNLPGDSTTIIFNGKYSYNSIPFIDTLPPIPLTFFIVIKGLKIENQDSLMKLNDRTFNLDGINNYVTLAYSNTSFSFQKAGNSSGSITFNKVQKDKSITFGSGTPDNPTIYRFILSGHFDFTINGLNNYNIKEGRFDMATLWKTNLNIEQ